jgi:ketosteroid isomerase-like protein
VSQANVERVRELYKLLRAGDPRELPPFVAPEATWEPERRTKRRRADNGDQLAERLLWRAVVHRFRVAELLDFGDRVLLTVVGRRMQYLGARWWSRSIFQVVTVRDGRIAKLEDFRSRAEALAALGVEPPS